MVSDVACVAALSARSLIYLQGLQKENLLPEVCLILAEYQEEIYEVINLPIQDKKFKYVDLNKSIGLLLEENKVPYILMHTKDINSPLAAKYLSSLSQKYLIYSGYGGCILKKHLFEIGKKWIHVHAGRLPMYRGSTTAYYSLLQEGVISATAIFMNEQIDAGSIIYSMNFLPPQNNVDIDYIYEPYVRSQVLINALSQYVKNNKFNEKKQNQEKSTTYFIIHPVLKNIALMNMKRTLEENGYEKQ